jgi:ketosteroid isomerase-like protein
MNRGLKSALAFFLLAITAACGLLTETEVERVHQARRHLQESYNGRDIPGLVTILTDDVSFLPPGAPAMVGRDNVVAMHQAAFRQSADRYTSSLEHFSEEIIVTGDWAVDRGTYVATITPLDGGEQGAYEHTYVYIWARQSDGSYKLWRAMANPTHRDEGG